MAHYENLTGEAQAVWCFEVIDKETHQVLISDKGFVSESEAEYYARMDIKMKNLKDYYIRTFPERE